MNTAPVEMQNNPWKGLKRFKAIPTAGDIHL